MAFLTIGSTDISVAPGGAKKVPQRIGSQARAWSGAMHESTRTWKDRYEFRTRWITRATANTLEGLLQGTPPLSVSGDFIGGTVNMFVVEMRIAEVQRMVRQGDMVIYEFVLEEA